jgi:hypothetical protein
MKLEICKVCYTFYEKDDEEQKWIVHHRKNEMKMMLMYLMGKRTEKINHD